MRLLALLVPFVCVPLLLPAAPASRAAPVPRAADKPVYHFPTQVGTKWASELRGPGGDFDIEEVVTKSEEKDGQILITVEVKVAGDPPTISQYAVSKDGVFRLGFTHNLGGPPVKCDPPYCHLKLPHKDGNTWENEDDKAFRRKHVAKKVETVKVPAGTFEAIRVETGKDIVSWFAPDVGLVKQDYGNDHLEMKSFEAPKK